MAITSRRRARDSSDNEEAYKVPPKIMSLKPATLMLDVNRSKAQAQSLEELKNNSAGLIVQWIRGLPKWPEDCKFKALTFILDVN